MRVATADRDSMEELSDVHGGAGPILFKRLWERDDFETAFTFVHAAVLLPGGGIGLHRRSDVVGVGLLDFLQRRTDRLEDLFQVGRRRRLECHVHAARIRPQLRCERQRADTAAGRAPNNLP